MALPTEELVRPAFWDDGTEGVEFLLTCGHFYGPVSNRSSTFDFPEDDHKCPVCGEFRQMHLELQAAIYQMWENRDA